MFSRTTIAAAVGASLLAAVTGCSSGFDKDKEGPEQDKSKSQSLRILIASSGDAETKAVKDAAAAWAKKTGNKATVELAKDINQQLGQAFAGNRPPDVFYVNSDQFANYAKGGSLYAYGDQISDVDDFSEQLRQSFTYEGKLVCLPKDTSTLGLVINSALWKKAGLGEDDYPKTWADLEKVAEKLTSGKVTGLVTNAEWARVGVFMKGAGGWITNADQTEVTADSPENAKGLNFAKKMLKAGTFKYANEIDTGWGGEALGKGKAAMTIEGNWVKGALDKDFPDVDYKVVELPAGPQGKATLAFSQCYGVASASEHRKAAVDLVKHLTTTEQQLAAAEQFGVMPSRNSALETYAAENPESKAWVDGAAYAQGPVTISGFDKVLGQFNTDIASLRKKDAKDMLADLQQNGQQVVEKGN